MGLIIQPLWLYIIGILAVLIIIIEILEKKLTIKKEVRKENKYLKKIKK